jgi:uncharacterized membrane protein
MTTVAAPETRRVVFVDLARAIAVLMMVEGHTLDALLMPEYHNASWFGAWSFVRGLTSCLFFFLAGFAFVLATYRRGEDAPRRAQAGRRFARFSFFLVLGYLLHSPVAHLAQLPFVSGDRWSGFLAVDALQCIAVSLAFVQLCAIVTGTRRRFLIAALATCAAVVAATPLVWGAGWVADMPHAIAAYAVPHTGSLFPLFPWSGYTLLGAAVGSGYLEMHHRAHNARLALAAVGVAMVVMALVSAQQSSPPSQFLLRAGLVQVIVAAVAHGSASLVRLPVAVDALARRSLLVYASHLCVVYGSAWNHGLQHWFGHALSLGPAILCVVALWSAMLGVAYLWHVWKERHPRRTRWVVHAAVAGLIVQMI